MFVKPLLVALALAASAMAAQAATIVDSLSTNTDPFDFTTNQGGTRNFNIAFSGPLGQSFALDGAYENLSVSALVSSFGSTADVSARIVSGAGIGGATIGTATPVSLTGIMGRANTLVTFDFSAIGELLAGTYTVVFSGTGTLAGGPVNVTAPGVYAGVDTAGTEAFGPTGSFNFGTNPARDFGIRVTADPVAAVPLPATGLMLVAALAGIGAMRRRGKRA